jgi:hypothetical protein
MQHGFMMGDIVFHPDYGTGEIVSRGARPGKYWVQVLFTDGKKRDIVNEEIKKLRRS